MKIQTKKKHIKTESFQNTKKKIKHKNNKTKTNRKHIPPQARVHSALALEY